MARTREEYNAYIREWRKKNRDKVKANNHSYYERNKGYLNKSRTMPWDKESIILWIKNGDREHIEIMERIIRPYKDRFIGI